MKPKSACVRMHNGRPTIHVDDVPMTPDFYALTHNHDACRSWDERPSRNIRAFAAAGIRLFQVDMYFEEIWKSDQTALDMEHLRRQVRGVLDQCPDASVVVRVHVNAPFWWNKAHPEELTGYCTGAVQDDKDGDAWSLERGDLDRARRASLASMVWRREAGVRLEELCRELSATPEGASVIGIHVSCGVYGEWHYWGFIENEPDCGLAMTRWFREWLRRTYGSDQQLRQAWADESASLDSATVPLTEERSVSHDGFFRDAAREQRVMDYYRAQHDVVADDIEYFCRIVKQSWPRPVITGVFYGYFHMLFCKQASGGHLCVERILNSPWVDYLSAPQSYWKDTRELGGAGFARGVIESTVLHGKLWLDELDNGGIRKDPEDRAYYAVALRSAALPLMRGTGVWYYDFGFNKQTGWWESPAIMRDVARVKQVFDQQLNRPYRPAADCLVVWDNEVYFHMRNGWTPVSYAQVDMSAEDIWRTGVATDHIYLFDLDKVDLSRYRAVVFANTWAMTAAQRSFVAGTVAAGGRTLLWNYLPGYVCGRRSDIAHVEELTGMKLARTKLPGRTPIVWEAPRHELEMESELDPAVCIVDDRAQVLARLGTCAVAARLSAPSHTSVFAAFPLRGVPVLRAVLADAGCHVYCDSSEPVYAADGLVLMHSATGGQRTLTLRSGARVTLALDGPSTVLVDAGTGERVL